jgi:predicted O-methyltransferase YrrM
MAFPPGHFHSPLPSFDDIARWERTNYGRDVDEIPGIDLRIDAQLELLRSLYADIEAHPFVACDGREPRFAFGNEWFTGYDALVYAALLRFQQPRRVVEIGSGWSTAALLDAFEGRPLPDITLIEPHPDRLFRLLRDEDHDRLAIVVERLQDSPPRIFGELESGDVLFVDSTHVAKLGSDVNQVCFQILPRLAPGVIVHFHDIAYPFEYEPPAVEQGYGWNEAYLLRAFLQFNHRFEILLWNDLVRSRLHDVVEREFPALLAYEYPGNEGSIWLRVVSRS